MSHSKPAPDYPKGSVESPLSSVAQKDFKRKFAATHVPDYDLPPFLAKACQTGVIEVKHQEEITEKELIDILELNSNYPIVGVTQVAHHIIARLKKQGYKIVKA